jgi:LIM domain
MTSIAERMKAFNANPGSSNKCGACGKAVYSADPQITLDGYKYHTACAKCQDCSCQITIRNFTKTDNLLLCKTHYFKRFHEEGSYMGGEKFIKSSKSTDSTESLRGAAAVAAATGVEEGVASEMKEAVAVAAVEAASPETECQA